MTKNVKILCIIPARGGSKQLPGKNIKILAGKTLIAWTIDAAKNSNMVDRIIVSTDDLEIANIAKRYHAEVPFLRPKHISGDEASSADVVLHAVEWLSKNNNYYPEIILLLQPTSPLRITEDINNSIKLLFETNAESVIGVTEARPHPYLCKTINSKNRLEDFFNIPIKGICRQQFPEMVAINGAIYLISTKTIKRTKSFYTKNTVPYYMPVERSIDIDTAWDFEIAQFIIENERI